MGFDISPLIDTIQYRGSTPDRIRDMRDFIHGKFIAIDAANVIYESRQTRRMGEYARKRGSVFQQSWKKSALRLVVDRCAQVVRHGATPIVVLEGNDARTGLRRGRLADKSAMAGKGSADWSAIVDALVQVCDLMGVKHVRAPGEGEALCAILTACGLADVAWTADVGDCMLFGATTVMFHSNGAPALCHRNPGKARFAVADTSEVQGGSESILAFAAMIGTDFNTGIAGLGKIRAKRCIEELVEQANRGTADEYIDLTYDIEIDNDRYPTSVLSLASARGEEFATQIKTLRDAVDLQVQAAQNVARRYSRSDLARSRADKQGLEKFLAGLSKSKESAKRAATSAAAF